MNERCIFLPAEGPALPAIRALRARYDPLAEVVPPHVTLVFPFALDWPGDRLAALLEQHRGDLPIPFTLAPPVADGDYLFFPLDRGRPAVADLHDRLYAALPAQLRADRPYVPHLTFGRLPSGPAATAALAEAARTGPWTGTAGRLVLERILDDGASEIEYVVS
jgi:2'-5' RNA ligase